MKRTIYTLLSLATLLFCGCAAKYAITASDSTHVKKNLVTSDSTHVKKSNVQIAHVDSVSSKQSHTVTVSDKQGNKVTVKVDSGKVKFNSKGQPTEIDGKNIVFSKSKTKSDKSNTVDVSQYKKTISDLTEIHKSDSTNNKHLSFQLDSVKTHKIELSATVTASNLWLAVLAAPGIIIALLALFAVIALWGFVSTIRFIFSLFKRKQAVA